MESTRVNSVIEKIEGLLRIVENEGATEGERENAQTLAQKLITKYQIEEAQLNNRVLDDEITSQIIKINNPYVLDKSVLLNAIAVNNFCRVSRGRNHATVYGYKSDIKMVLSMYKMLELDMINEMWKALRIYGGSAPTVSFKKSFFGGYSNRIRQRLAAAKKEQITNVAKETGSNQFELVLVNRNQEIEDFFNKLNFRSSGSRTLTSASGWGAGQSAGSRANIGQARLSGQGALNR